MVGENFDGYGARIAPYYQALDSQYDFSLYYHIEATGYNPAVQSTSLGDQQNSETVRPFSNATANDIWVDGAVAYKLPGGGRSDFINSAFTSNHDIARAINHVNNNKEKITGTAQEVNRAKVAAAITILNPGVSWIYYGDELGMSSNTDQHKPLYTYENNIDLWYRQPYKWGNDEITTDYQFNGYKVEWDSYNTTIKSLAQQKEKDDDGDIYDVYKQLIAIKNLYGKNAKYTGEYNNSNTSVYKFIVKTDTGNFEVLIHTGNNNSNNLSVSTSGQYWFINNGNNKTSLQPYGVYVRKY